MSYFYWSLLDPYWPYRPLPGSHKPGHSIFESPVGLLASTPVLTTNSVSMFLQQGLLHNPGGDAIISYLARLKFNFSHEMTRLKDIKKSCHVKS